MFNFASLRLGALALVFLGGCAQAPVGELALASNRVEVARSVDAAIFAPDRFSQAEVALATAQRLIEDHDYRGSVDSASEAVLHADDAFEVSTVEKSIAERRFERCLKELEGLMAIARSRGAASAAPDELAAFVERHRAVKAIAENGDLLAALEQGQQLEPELLVFEQRFRD